MNQRYAPELSLPKAAESRGPAAWAAPLSVAIVAVLVYLITLHGTFIYDDAWVILKNWRVTHDWGKIWTTPYALRGPDRLWRPLTLLTFAIEYRIHGATAWPYHLINIVLHAGVSVAVVALGRKLAGPRAGWIAGALFAVHPVHVEAVAGIVGRAELMCTLATLVGLWLFLKPPSGRRVVGICACFLV
ncbi:MAG: protein O-mannosyl-transferase, partial [Phycisphaerales bacterium]|nr:protein O-mannosyl-transferase [Phycisphaerales bacterium]